MRGGLLFLLVLLAGCPEEGDVRQDHPPQDRDKGRVPMEPSGTAGLAFAREAIQDRFDQVYQTYLKEHAEAENEYDRCFAKKRMYESGTTICLDALNERLNIGQCGAILSQGTICCTGFQEKDGVKVTPGTCE